MANLFLPEGELIFSVQAVKGSFLEDSTSLVNIAKEVLKGGAKALRLARGEIIGQVSKLTSLPIVGLIKTERLNYGPRITQSVDEIEEIANSGAKVVAIDSTLRARPVPLSVLYSKASDLGLEIFADIDTIESAMSAIDLGATYLATTMAGYTEERAITIGPDFSLLSEMIALGPPVILEGRVRNTEDAKRALALGAYAVVVGRSATSPKDIVEQYLQGTRR